jgi:hypothetical protein
VQFMQSLAAPAMSARILDVVVDQERVVQELQCGRRPESVLHRSAEGLTGCQHQAGPESFARTSRVVERKVPQIAPTSSRNAPHHFRRDECRVLRERTFESIEPAIVTLVRRRGIRGESEIHDATITISTATAASVTPSAKTKPW